MLTPLLELRTLLLTNVVSMVICLAVIAVVWRSHRERFPATRYWLVAVGLQVVSFALILLRGQIPDALSVVAAAWMISTGFIKLLQGVALYLERPYPVRHDYVLQAAFLLVHAYFTYVDPSLLWRTVNYSLFLAWLSAECACLVWRSAAERRQEALFFGVVMIAYALLFSGRIVYYAFSRPHPDFFQASSYDLWMYLGTQALLVSLTFSLVLMVNRRLMHALEADIESRLRAEEAMQVNMARLARAELAAKTGNWELNLATRTMASSVGAARIYGLTATQADYEAIRAVPLPEYRPMLDAAMTALIERQAPYDVEFSIRAVDSGEIKEIHSTAEYDAKRRTVFGVIRDITERKQIEHALEHLVQIDPLTGVFSRRHFIAMTERELANAARYATPLSALMLDIDHFKRVNDTYGHQVGDLVLQQLGEVFRGFLREVDVVGRYGGEEFAIVLPKTDLARALDVSERLRRRVEESRIRLEHGLPLTVTVSIGVTALGAAGENVDALLARADRALYDAKRQGRNRVCVSEASINSSFSDEAAPA